VASIFDEASDELHMDVSHLCTETDASFLSMTMNTQLAVFVMDCATDEVLRSEFGLKPAAVAGHSLGEYAALCRNGAISFIDALKIVRVRSKLMHDSSRKQPGKMLAVRGITNSRLRSYCLSASQNTGNFVEIACENSSDAFVVAVSEPALSIFTSAISQTNARVIDLGLSGAFHCSAMSSATTELAADLDKMIFRYPACPVVSNVTALPHSLETVKRMLCLQLTTTVLWHPSINYLSSEGFDTFIEVGPGTVLRDLNNLPSDKSICLAFDDINDQKKLRHHTIIRSDSLKLIDKCLYLAETRPSRNPEAHLYTAIASPAYTRLKQMREAISAGSPAQSPTPAEISSVFIDLIRAKCLPAAETETILQSVRTVMP
jgi:[acyl-carrier-protein] S-malonyltransferase